MPSLKNKSDFIPIIPNNDCIDTFKRVIVNELEHMNMLNKHSNLTRGEKEALKDLKSDQSILIKPADKGGGVVILDIEDYEQEMSRLLNDPETYKKLTMDPTVRNKKEFEVILDRAKTKGIIN